MSVFCLQQVSLRGKGRAEREGLALSSEEGWLTWTSMEKDASKGKRGCLLPQ